MRRPIVVAVDGSEESLRAAEWAANEASRRKAPLRIVAAPGQPPRMHGYQTSLPTVENALRGMAARGLAAAVERVAEMAPGIAIDTDLIDGPPAVAVTESAAGAELLVVGARGVGGFTALVLGSLSRYVASYAPCPAVVVREETVAVHKEIVVGVRELDASSTATLGFAFDEAALRNSRLLVVHAVPLPIASSRISPVGTAAVAEVTAEATSRLADLLDSWREKYPEVNARADVVRSHPARVLASLSGRADLVIVGRHGTPGGPGGSSIQHAVLGHASGPVAIVPSDLSA